MKQQNTTKGHVPHIGNEQGLLGHKKLTEEEGKKYRIGI